MIAGCSQLLIRESSDGKFYKEFGETKQDKTKMG